MNKIYNAAIVVLSLVIIWLCLNQCNAPKPVITADRIKDSLKKEVRKDLMAKDSVHKVVVYRDSIRTKVIWKYRSVKHLDLPCDTMLEIIFAECDTIIKVDSTLISELRAELFIDDLIIDNQKTIIKSDSVAIAGLQKQVRKQKRRKKFFMAVALALGLVAVVK
jgi:hypothetical protein